MPSTEPRPDDIAILDIESDIWTDFVANHPDATPFHHPSWIGLIADCYRLRPQVAAVFDSEGTIAAGLPLIVVGRGSRRRWVSLPFTDRCAPLLGPGVASSALFERLGHILQDLGLRRIEVRDRVDTTIGWSVPQGHWHELQLDPEPDRLYARLHKSRVKSSLRRAERERITVELGTSRRDLCNVFYELHAATRRRLGVAVQPRRFFKLLWDRMLARDLGFVLVARKGTTPVAAAVFLAANGRVTYKFSASDRRYASIGAGNAVLWEAIQRSCRRGEQVFDFGRTEQGNEGLRAFKLGWGVCEEPLAYTVLAPSPPTPTSRRANAALGVVIRRSPVWVARTVGALAYRYTA